MTIREMQVEDLDQVIALEEELFSVPWTKEGFFSFLLRDNTLFLVVEEKEQILGYCGVMLVLDEGEITNVAVSAKRQREGIGQFLLEGLFLLLRERGIRVLHLEVRESNQTALRLYERVGFQRDGLRRNYYTDPVEDAVLMSRREKFL